MTRIYRRRFLVRGHEMGATGYVHDSVFLHYVQQVAYEASSDAGYDIRKYNALGTVWVIRCQTIVFLVPLIYNDVIEASTWVSDFRRVRSHRECELRRVSDGCLVALAQTDWVYIDAATLFPRRISSEMIDAFQPNGKVALDAAPSLERAQEVEGRTFVYRHRVKSYELDNIRHVNNANYLNWLSEARLNALAEAGFSMDAGSAHLQGLGLTLSPVRYEIEYFIPAVFDDELEVVSRVVAAGETQLTWSHEIRRGEERLVQAMATVCFERDGAVRSLPEHWLEVLGV